MLTETESQILHLLRQSPKTWRELVPSFSDRAEMNRALLLLEQRNQITYDLKLGVYRVASQPPDNVPKSTNPNPSTTKPSAEWAKSKKDAYDYFGDLGPQVKAAKNLKSRGVKIKKTTLIAELIRLSDEKFPGSRTGVEKWKEIVRMTPIHQALKRAGWRK